MATQWFLIDQASNKSHTENHLQFVALLRIWMFKQIFFYMFHSFHHRPNIMH